jgi:SAM-dependent methyltransferase
MITGKAFGQLWSHGARDWASFVEPHYQSLYQAVHDRLGITEGTRVLDVGCGATCFRARGAGLDASPDSIEVARERVPKGDFRVGDIGTAHRTRRGVARRRSVPSALEWPVSQNL